MFKIKVDGAKKRRLKGILGVQSKSREEGRMRQAVLARLENIKKSLPVKERKTFIIEQIGDGNIYVTKGKLSGRQKYPCVVSHIDTVHSIVESYGIFEMNGFFFAFDGDALEQYGTGGDDKVGIFITLEMLRVKKKMKAAFFVEEEIGLCGSRDAPKKFFENCGYALQCDRKGHSDFVNEIGTKLFGTKFSKEIAPILETYNYKETSGGSTDVVSIKDKVDICVANMSCGYFSPHSSREVVHIYSVMKCMQMVSDLVDKLGCKLWKYKYVAPKPKTVVKHISGFRPDDDKDLSRHSGYSGTNATSGGWGLSEGEIWCKTHNKLRVNKPGYSGRICTICMDEAKDGLMCPICQIQALEHYNEHSDEGKFYYCWSCGEIPGTLMKKHHDIDIGNSGKFDGQACIECRGVNTEYYEYGDRHFCEDCRDFFYCDENDERNTILT